MLQYMYISIIVTIFWSNTVNKHSSNARSAGYAYFIEKYQLTVMPHWHKSSVSSASTHHSKSQDGFIKDIYPQSYWPNGGDGNHLEFALKYDGVNLAILYTIFNTIDEKDLLTYIKTKPTGKYARRIWFLYEFLTGKELPLQNLTKGNYTELLEPKRYYTVIPGERIQRQRIVNNLLGNKKFCPIVRRTEQLRTIESEDFDKRCKDILTSYTPELLRRAQSYLYSKETKSSFEIEHIKPSASRTEKFIGLLEIAAHKDFCRKDLLIDVQNRIVDPRFKDTNYRTSQNYVGQTVSYQKEIIHYICPAPHDLPKLMEGLLLSHCSMKDGDISAIIHATIIAYGFVFMHPFEDGNGRIHRFLLHNIMSIRGIIPKGLMFPVSAAMLNNPVAYDKSLESFSRPLMQLIEYTLDDLGQMEVHNDTSYFYRYIDMTLQAEVLYDFVKMTIEKELIEELNFLENYDNTKKAIQEIIDMPDRLIDLFIQLCLQNKGTLSSRKRTTHFDFLTDEEMSLMEQAVKTRFNNKQNQNEQ